MTLVSVCIPCHNAAPYVGAALESLLAQTWGNLEVIVVNDGSTDGSGEVLSRFEAAGVKVIHESCGSAAKSRNRALCEASGDYIKFFDADDLMSPGMIERQMARLDGRQDAVASSEWGRFHGDDLATFKSNPQSVWRDMKAGDWLVEAWADARPMMQPGMFLIPRAIMDAAGGWDEDLTLIDDFEFFTRVICETKDVFFSPDAILYYRSGLAGSLSQRKARRAVESAYHSLLQGTSRLLDLRSDTEARLSCANLLQDFIYSFYPLHRDLSKSLERHTEELGGSNLEPDGPPRFQLLRRFVGWKLARRIQILAGR